MESKYQQRYTYHSLGTIVVYYLCLRGDVVVFSNYSPTLEFRVLASAVLDHLSPGPDLSLV